VETVKEEEEEGSEKKQESQYRLEREIYSKTIRTMIGRIIATVQITIIFRFGES